MKWFKHYTDSHRGVNLNFIYEQLGHTGLSCYWLLVELCAEKLEENPDCKFIFNASYLSNILRIKPKRLENILRTYQQSNQLNFERSDNNVRIDFSKLLEIRHKDSFSSRHRRASGGPVAGLDKELRIKNKEEDINPPNKTEPAKSRSVNIFNNATNNKFLEKVSAETQNLWLTTYTDKKWIEEELKKAVIWISVNKSKAPKSNFGRFFSSWLSRGWERHRKNLPPSRTSGGVVPHV